MNTDAGTHPLPIRCPRGCGDPSPSPFVKHVITRKIARSAPTNPFPLDGGRLEPALVKTGDGGEPPPDNILSRRDGSRTVRHPPEDRAAPFRHSGESRNPSLIPPSCHLEAPRGTPYWGALHRSKIPPTRQAAPLPYRSFPLRACPCEYGGGNPSPPHPLSSRMRGPIPSPLPAPTCHSERSEAESRNLVSLHATPVPPLVFLIILPSTFSPYQHSYPLP